MLGERDGGEYDWHEPPGPEEPPLCAYCGQPAEGNYSIHRDGFGVGPQVPLCDGHGGGDLPTCEQIWEKLRKGGAR